MGTMSTDEPTTSHQGEDESGAEETKRRFREALAAKHGRHGEDHLDGGRAAGHAHGQVQGKRTFRRKTG